MNKVLLIVMLMLGGIIMEKTIVTGDPRVDWKIRRGVPIEYVKKVPDTVMVGETTAQILVPSSFYLDLRGYYVDGNQRRFTADWITVHDSSTPPKTLGVGAFNLTNDITTAASPGGRDTAGALANGWVYFYVIYSTTLQSVSTLSSISATTPTLPTGYDYFARVGSAKKVVGSLHSTAQVDAYHWYETYPLFNGSPSVVDTYQDLSCVNSVPPTAKVMFGSFGIDHDHTDPYGMSIASNSTGQDANRNVFPPSAIIGGYNLQGTNFMVPLVTAQTIWWAASYNAGPMFIIHVKGWIDDL